MKGVQGIMERVGLAEQVKALRSRKAEVARKLEASIDSLADEMAQSASLIDQKERELNELRARYRTLEAAAKRYLDGDGVNLFDMNIVQFGAERQKRTRTDLRGTVLDLSELRKTVSHRFAETGEVVIGTLDEAKVAALQGQPWTGTSAELVDTLWKVPGGEGFYSHTAGRGVKLNPLAVFKEKGRGKLVAPEPEKTVS